MNFTHRTFRTAALATTAASVFMLAGCGGGSDSESSSTTTNAQTDGNTAAPANNTGNTSAGQQAAATTPPAEATPAQNWTNATPEGTVHLFANAMADADYMMASQYLDPSTEVFNSLLKTAEAVAKLEANAADGDTQSQMALNLTNAIFSTRYKSFEVVPVATEGDRSQQMIDFKAEGDVDMKLDLQQIDGVWLIQGDQTLLQPSKAVVNDLPQPQQGPPAPAQRPEPPSDTDVPGNPG